MSEEKKVIDEGASIWKFDIPEEHLTPIKKGLPCEYIAGRVQGAVECNNCTYNCGLNICKGGRKEDGTYRMALGAGKCAARHYGSWHIRATLRRIKAVKQMMREDAANAQENETKTEK